MTAKSIELRRPLPWPNQLARIIDWTNCGHHHWTNMPAPFIESARTAMAAAVVSATISISTEVTRAAVIYDKMKGIYYF